ncbi:uncharacterized protein LOC129582253 [Paramacrobiotus metropolitanus]|uniref:uncharacterized protein LOC129582253 n=1 Tax=Paramacrobiotus metropolitanus TaxID=2943436 RepID=UPI002445CC85|nr:uncharacterized protein LOC129582253 [Paramacrobiotus metropolitanus]
MVVANFYAKLVMQLGVRLLLLWTPVQASVQCRCFPGDACWPSADEWSALNVTLGGKLIVTVPTAHPCYVGHASECLSIKASYKKEDYLSSKPGSMHYFNWEELNDQQCPLEHEALSNATCQQGRVPAFAVDAHTVDHIRAALHFATQHNLRVVVKSTGHDYLGRSTAAGALMIWMRNFQGDIQTKASFMPYGCNDTVSRSPGAVITVPAGKVWKDVYETIEREFNHTQWMVGGHCPSISAVGGFTLGGGHSILSPAWGLAVENMLEATVVTADGQHLTANACHNPDLFFALRGGGGGTFGVVTSVTYELHPVPHGFWSYSFVVVNANPTGTLTASQLEIIVEELAAYTFTMMSLGWGGYLMYNPKFGASFLFLIPALKAEHTAGGVVQWLIDSLEEKQAAAEFVVEPFGNASFFQRFPSFKAWKAWTDTLGILDDFDASGFRMSLGSRLIPDYIYEPQYVAKKVVLGALKNGLENGFTLAIARGYASGERDDLIMETAVTPAWRRADFLAGLSIRWNATATPAEIAAKQAALNSGLQVWRDAFPHAGVYLNEIGLDEPNWQEAAWGEHYPKLLKIKQRVDPNGVFLCRMCVCSEGWDLSGLRTCRVRPNS